jgi:type VI secretion system secreted protein Hcp
MAVDIFMKLDPLKGESKDTKHKEEIDVISWGWGMDQTGTWHSGGGGGAGKANVHDLSFSHLVDKASPDLMKACLMGKHLPKGVLTVRKVGAGQGSNPALEFIIVTIEDIIVTSVTLGGSHEDDYVEHVTLNFAKLKFEYTEQTTSGGGGAKPYVTWNIPANAES